MIVGTAEVEVRALTRRVRGDIKDSFDKGMQGVGTNAGEEFDKEMQPQVNKTADKSAETISKKVGKSGDSAGVDFGRRFQKKVTSSVGGGGSGGWIRRMFGNEGGASGDSFGRRFVERVDKHFQKAGIGKKLMLSLTSFIGPLAGTIGALGGGLVALTSTIASAAGSVPVLYSSMLSLVSVMGAVKLATGGVGKAIHDSLSGNTKLYHQDLKALQPAQREFVKTIHSLRPEIDALKQTAAKNLFPGVTAGIKAAMPLFTPFDKMIGSLDHSVGNMVKRIGQLAGGPLKGQLTDEMRMNGRIVSQLTQAVVSLFSAFVRVEHEMQPVQLQFAKLAHRGADYLAHVTKVNQANGKMADYFHRSFDRAKLLGSVLGNLVRTLDHIFHAASPAGDSMFKSLDRVTNRWATITGRSDTQKGMAAYFKSTIPVVKEVMGILGDIIKGFGSLGNNATLLPLLQQIRGELLPAIGQLLSVTTGPLASSLITLATNITKIISALSKGGGGFLNSFFRTLNGLATGLNKILSIPGLGNLAGILLSISGAIAAVGLATSKLKILKLWTMLMPGSKGALGKGGAAGGGGIFGKVLGDAKPVHVFVDNWEMMKGGGGGGGGGGGKAPIVTATEEEAAAGGVGARSVLKRVGSKIKSGAREGLRRGIQGVVAAAVGTAVGDALTSAGHKRAGYATKNAAQTYGALSIFGPEVAGPATAFVALTSLIGRSGLGSNLKGKEKRAWEGTGHTTAAQGAKAQMYLQSHPAVYANLQHEFPHMTATQITQYAAGAGLVPGIRPMGAAVAKGLKPGVDVKQAGEDVLDVFLAGMKHRTPQAVAAAKLAAAAVVKQLALSGTYTVNIGEQILDGLIAGMKHKTPQAVQQAKISTAATMKQIHLSAELGSPSRLTRKYGRWTMDGWILGMRDRATAAKQAAHGVVSHALGAPADLSGLGRTPGGNHGMVGSQAAETQALGQHMLRQSAQLERLIGAVESTPHGIVREQAKRGGSQWSSAELLAS